MRQYAEAPSVDIGTSAAAAFPVARPSVTFRRVRLAALPSAVPWARRILRHELRELQLENLVDSALLLVSELVTNAVQASAHNTSPDPDQLPMIGLSLQVTNTSLFTEVWDGSPGLPARRETDLMGDNGRGLLLVDSLADAWGHEVADGGKVVWCTLTIPD